MTLIERIEAASKPVRELDGAICTELGRTVLAFTRHERVDPFGKSDEWREVQDTTAPAFTASLDAAMTLVPEGWSWSTGDELAFTPKGEQSSWAWVSKSKTGEFHIDRAATPALALCAAALTARALTEPSL